MKTPTAEERASEIVEKWYANIAPMILPASITLDLQERCVVSIRAAETAQRERDAAKCNDETAGEETPDYFKGYRMAQIDIALAIRAQE